MFGVVLGGGIAVALIAALVVVARRRDRADRRRLGLDLPAKPDPALVDRTYDPSLCAYCDDACVTACRACTRPTCGAHRPWPAHRFCYGCEAEWSRGARRRNLIIAPIVVAAMAATALAIAGVAAAALGRVTAQLGLLAIIAPIAIAAPLAAALDRLMRRRFRPTGTLPEAAVRR